MSGAAALNDDPFSEPAFLAGLEAAGYLQRLDTSEARITARFQHALTKMNFAAHSEEFCGRAGIKKVHRSTVQFFNEDSVADPFIHIQVATLPRPRQALVTPKGCETSGWTPIGSEDEADGTVHYTVSHPGFWPVTVVFDVNQSHLFDEDKYASIRAADDSEGSGSDAEEYLGRYSGRRGSTSRSGGMSRSYSGYEGGAGRSSSRRRDAAGFYAGEDAGYSSRGAARRSSSRAGSRRGSMYADGAGAGDDSSDSEAEAENRYSRRGGGGMSSSRRGSMSARELDSAMADMQLARSASRASRARSERRNSYRSGAGY